MTAIKKKVEKKGNFEIFLGSSPECDYAFTNLGDMISPRHAALKREGDRLFLRDLKSSQGTRINEKRISGKWHEITLNDKVLLGEIELEIKPRLLLGRDRVGLDAHNLFFSIPDRSKGLFSSKRRVLTNNVSVSAEPETLIGIMGPSGAGKTVLLNLMSGYLRPEKGRVMVGNFDVHKSFGLIKDIIGYVPQDDTLIPELKVLQSLHYSLRLGYPDMKASVRQKLIESVLEGMGFTTGSRLEKLLHTKIGSPEQRGLSGGERRRVNIAHELVRNPLLLFLDEPTSGLSSVDSEHVVSLLKDICTERKVTVLMTIHQPSGPIFNLLDKLLLVNTGGNIVYFGPASDVVSHFREHSEESTEGNPAEYVLRVLANKGSWKSPLSPEELCQKQQSSAPDENEHQDEASPAEARKRRKVRKKAPLFYQFFLLAKRNIHVKASDKASLALLLFQAIIISALLVFTFRGFQTDYVPFDQFAKTWFHFVSQYDEAVVRQDTVIAEPLFRESKEWATKNSPHMIGEFAAQRRASILFLLIASAIWFGVVNAAREIVSEKSILQRETRASLRISPYLMSKVCVLSMIALIQTGILLSVTCNVLLPVGLASFLRFWLILLTTSVAASCLSLFVSSVAKTEQFSLMAVPILIIPQLFLGGLIRPFKFFSDTFHLSDLILQKWAFKALLSCDSVGQNVLVQTIDLTHRDPVKYITFVRQTFADTFFGRGGDMFLSHIPAMPHAFLMILLHAFIPLLLSYFWLKRKYS